MRFRRHLKYYLYALWWPVPRWTADYLFERAIGRLRPSQAVIDAGANVGKFTRMLAASGATVHAFEPDPAAFAALEKNTADMPNVLRYQKAVGLSAGAVRMYRHVSYDDDPESCSVASSMFADKHNIDESNSVQAQQIDLLAFIRALPSKIELLKLDIEGQEVPILEALLKDETLMDKVGLIFAETHERKIPSLRHRTETLRDLAAAAWRGRVNLDWK
jgi:FkbM family methyltransferase